MEQQLQKSSNTSWDKDSKKCDVCLGEIKKYAKYYECKRPNFLYKDSKIIFICCDCELNHYPCKPTIKGHVHNCQEYDGSSLAELEI